MQCNPKERRSELLHTRGQCAPAGTQPGGSPQSCLSDARTCAVGQLPGLMRSVFSHQRKGNWGRVALQQVQDPGSGRCNVATRNSASSKH